MPTHIQHIYWFASYHAICPSTRYRAIIPLKQLAQQGITYNFVFPDRSLKGIRNFLTIFFHALFFRKNNSLIAIQKVVSNGFYANSLKLLLFFQKKRTLYDLDDAEQFRTNPDTMHFFLRNCEQVSVGSKYLYDYCLAFNRRVFMQTSPVYTHGVIKTKRNAKLCIGWVGDLGNGNSIAKPFSHKTSLYEYIFPEIRKLTQPIRLVLIGVKTPSDIPELNQFFEDCPHIEVDIPTNLIWENDEWIYPEIAKFDIGVSPMLDHPFNRSKSAFKSKQYLSVGVPTLATGVGENKKFVLDSQTGFICDSGPDFLACIQRIAAMDDATYFNMSKNALARTCEYSIERYCKQLLDNC